MLLTQVTLRLDSGPSTSLSFVSTSTITVVLRSVETLSLVATGASFIQVTVILPVAMLLLAAPKVSISLKLKLSVPQKFAVGV